MTPEVGYFVVRLVLSSIGAGILAFSWREFRNPRYFDSAEIDMVRPSRRHRARRVEKVAAAVSLAVGAMVMAIGLGGLWLGIIELF